MSKKKTLNKEQQQLAAEHVEFAARITRKIAEKAGIELKGNQELFERMNEVAQEAMVRRALDYNPKNANGASFETFCTDYIKGKLGHFIGKECRGIYRSDYAYQKVRMVSFDEQIGDGEDSCTREETIASDSFDEWQSESQMKDLVEQILKGLTPKEVQVVKAKFWSKDEDEDLAKLAKKRGRSVSWIKGESRRVMMKMREIAAKKGLTFNS